MLDRIEALSKEWDGPTKILVSQFKWHSEDVAYRNGIVIFTKYTSLGVFLSGVMAAVLGITLGWEMERVAWIGIVVAVISAVFYFLYWDSRRTERTRRESAGAAGPLIPFLLEELHQWDRTLELLKKFVKTKNTLELTTSPDIEKLLNARIDMLERQRAELISKIEFVGKLWGVRAEDFENAAEIIFEEDPEARVSLQEMMWASILNISSTIEVEEALADPPIDLESHRLRKGNG